MNTCPRPQKSTACNEERTHAEAAGPAQLIRTLAGLDQSQEPGCANGGQADRGMNTAALCLQLTSVVAALVAAGHGSGPPR